jgi:hypothetical protein
VLLDKSGNRKYLQFASDERRAMAAAAAAEERNHDSAGPKRLCDRRCRLRLRRDRRAMEAVNALDCVDGRGIAGATTTEDPATTTS